MQTAAAQPEGRYLNASLFLTRFDKLTQVMRSRDLLRALLYHRVLAGAEHRQVLSVDLTTVIDIGANRGQFSVAVRRWAVEARVVAFEPLSGPAARFCKVFQNDSKVDLHQAAKPLRKEEAITDISNQCEYEGIRFRIVPDFFRVIQNRAVLNTLGGIPLIAVRTEPLNILSNRLIKRAFDIVASVVLLILLSPFFLMLSLIIKFTSSGPIFFKQKRIGANNVEFDIYKFQSMHVQNPSDSDTVWTTENDQRVTSIGRFMRKTNLDELPQLWNVFIGNMSLVGPRPERDHFVEKFKKEIPHYKVRHQSKSGITGWAQVNG